jgi:DENN domain-containing protein 1
MTDDLINLDINNSFEIEDFDPLNDKAKPIPQKPAPNLRSTTLPATVAGFNNPVYPYFTPTRMTHNSSMMTGTTSNTTLAANHDDNELLKTYGLDHFTISNSSKMPNGGGRTHNGFTITDAKNMSSTNNSRTSSKNHQTNNHAVTNWTTFD